MLLTLQDASASPGADSRLLNLLNWRLSFPKVQPVWSAEDAVNEDVRGLRSWCVEELLRSRQHRQEDASDAVRDFMLQAVMVSEGRDLTGQEAPDRCIASEAASFRLV